MSWVSNLRYPGLLRSSSGAWRIEHRFEPAGREWIFALPMVPQDVAEEMYRRFCLDPLGFTAVLARHRAAQEMVTISMLHERWAASKKRSQSRHRLLGIVVGRLLDLIGDRLVSDVSEGDAQLFEEAIVRDALLPSTHVLYVRGMISLWRFAMSKHWAVECPFSSIVLPTNLERVQAIPRVVDQAELVQLFRKKEEEVIRWYVQTLWITGCRPCEPTRLVLKNLRISGGDAELIIPANASKTRQRRVVPVSGEAAVVVVTRFLAERQERLPGECWIRRRLKEEFRRLKAPPTPLGGFRHSRITLWVDAGHPELMVAKWAGTSVEYLRENYYRIEREQNARAWPEPALDDDVLNQRGGSDGSQ